MREPTAVVFGAGKIARGFIAHLLALSGYRIVFVEKSAPLVAALRGRGRYRIHVMGAPEKSLTIEGFEVLSADATDAVAACVVTADVVFVSIGGPNLPQIVPALVEAVRRACTGGRSETLNVILCENYFQPAQWLREMVEGELAPPEMEWFERHVGIVETMVLRSTVEPTPELKAEDPLCLKAQDMWEMPADREAFVGPVPPVVGLLPKDDFQGGLIRKLFTYNSTNAVIAYVGHRKGHQYLSDAANDPEVLELARSAARESGEALCQRFGFDPREQEEFAEASIAKYRKREIVDPIERNARDPIRKLGRNDRLIGPASLALEYGIRPIALSQGIAAALLYDHSADPSAQKLQSAIREKGLAQTLREVCGIEPDGALAAMVTEAYRQAKESSVKA